jgi:quaternary ammonium compound-resistance protein SugE
MSRTAWSAKGRAVTWILVVCAGLLEVGWAYAMKRSEGFTLPGPSLAAILLMIASFWLLSVAMRTLSLGTAYTIWTGIGAVGAFVIGIAALGEAATPMRLLAAALIVAGIALMKVSG